MALARFATITFVLSVATMSFSGTGSAAWIGTVGKVHRIDGYAGSDTILVTLDNQPTGPVPPGCTSTSVFAINGALPAERRQLLLSQLFSAQGRGASVAIYWGDSGSCVSYSSTTIVPAIQRITSMP